MPEAQVMYLKAANGMSVPFLVVQDAAGNYQLASTLLDASGNQISLTNAGEIKALIDSAQVNVDGTLTIADGADVTLGSKSDAAVTNPTLSASEVALLKGLLKQLQGSGTGSMPVALAGSVALLQDNLTLTGAYQQLPNTPCRSITIQAEPTNGGFVYIGNFNTVSSANHICTLSPGSSVTILASNFDQVFVIGTAGDAICVGGEQ
jgi:hypothetical protein